MSFVETTSLIGFAVSATIGALLLLLGIVLLRSYADRAAMWKFAVGWFIIIVSAFFGVAAVPPLMDYWDARQVRVLAHSESLAQSAVVNSAASVAAAAEQPRALDPTTPTLGHKDLYDVTKRWAIDSVEYLVWKLNARSHDPNGYVQLSGMAETMCMDLASGAHVSEYLDYWSSQSAWHQGFRPRVTDVVWSIQDSYGERLTAADEWWLAGRDLFESAVNDLCPLYGYVAE